MWFGRQTIDKTYGVFALAAPCEAFGFVVTTIPPTLFNDPDAGAAGTTHKPRQVIECSDRAEPADEKGRVGQTVFVLCTSYLSECCRG